MSNIGGALPPQSEYWGGWSPPSPPSSYAPGVVEPLHGGWMKVAEMYCDCPSGFVESNETGIHQCRIGENRCLSVNYPTFDVSYSSVCGGISAYQVGSTDAFRGTSDPDTTVDSNYVDGVSLTHGINPSI